MKVRKSLRHIEYYNLQEQLDELYTQSQEGKYFKKLIEIMINESNILLAYRNIKRNKGSNTPGTDNLTIKDIAELSPEEVVSRIGSMFDNYKPQPVRRKFIPKPNGKKRPLGIPCIWDRLFQQCILQVLEPICEAKFHKHSYGFRPNRSAHHAIARMNYLVYKVELYHCVDVDIEGFFDNVNHGKLLKQLWTIGIRDKKLLSIISSLLKAEIAGEGIPIKGTPQGGILSPLLANVVLNELDWWISDQWETFKTKHDYVDVNQYRALKNTKLKEMYIVRYADDFKILCRTHTQAYKAKFAVEKFLSERLHLKCSEDKSNIVNLKKQWSEFLGIEIKAKIKGYKDNRIWKSKWIKDETTGKGKRRNVLTEIITRPQYVTTSRMTEKAKNNAHSKIKDAIKVIQKRPTPNNVIKYNSIITGIQNYYSVATNISLDLSEIDAKCLRTMHIRLSRKLADKTKLTKAQKDRYDGYNRKLYAIGNIVLSPISAQRYKPPKNFNPQISNYTDEGRRLIHKRLMKIAPLMLRILSSRYISNRNIEYHDNRISKFVAQNGKCFVTGDELGITGWHCHHIIPYYISSDDSFSNLVIVEDEIHRLIHMVDKDKIARSLKILNLKGSSLKKLNVLREKVGLYPIRLKSLKVG
nr:group II intron reverse transcriptase/maturase [Cytobacillus praedii]